MRVDAVSGAVVIRGADVVEPADMPAGRGKVTLGRLLLVAPARDQTTCISPTGASATAELSPPSGASSRPTLKKAKKSAVVLINSDSESD